MFKPFPAHTALALITVLLAAPVAVMAQEDHAHSHTQSGAAIANLALDGDHKWATDAPLRSGMAAIRKAFDADHPAIHKGIESDAQYTTLADHIEAEVQKIVATCHLPPAADGNLHLVIADLLQGAAAMRGQATGASRHDGAARVHGALMAYAKYFDDPGAS